MNSTRIDALAKRMLASTAVMAHELIHSVLLITQEREQLKLTMPCDFLVFLEYTQLYEFKLIFKIPA